MQLGLLNMLVEKHGGSLELFFMSEDRKLHRVSACAIDGPDLILYDGAEQPTPAFSPTLPVHKIQPEPAAHDSGKMGDQT
jgi:hypothetical protein